MLFYWIGNHMASKISLRGSEEWLASQFIVLFCSFLSVCVFVYVMCRVLCASIWHNKRWRLKKLNSWKSGGARAAVPHYDWLRQCVRETSGTWRLTSSWYLVATYRALRSLLNVHCRPHDEWCIIRVGRCSLRIIDDDNFDGWVAVWIQPTTELCGPQHCDICCCCSEWMTE